MSKSDRIEGENFLMALEAEKNYRAKWKFKVQASMGGNTSHGLRKLEMKQFSFVYVSLNLFWSTSAISTNAIAEIDWNRSQHNE